MMVSLFVYYSCVHARVRFLTLPGVPWSITPTGAFSKNRPDRRSIEMNR